ncbi:unnamed protein product [Pylaiella littoralis]
MMIHPAMRASAVRAACRRSATGAGASAGALAGRQQERTATTAAAGPLCGGRSSSSVASTLPRVQQRHLLGRIESEIPPPSTTRHRGFASAVATTFADEEVFGRAVAAAAATEAAAAENVGEGSGAEEQAVEHKPKPRRRLLRDRPAPITLTDRAAQHLLSLVASKPGKVGVRLGVKRRGCNGMSYTLKYADEKPKGDEEVVVQAVASASAAGAPTGALAAVAAGSLAAAADVKLFVDPMATLYIAGTVMDWEETELSSEFTFTNPNAKGECGCGESFNV